MNKILYCTIVVLIACGFAIWNASIDNSNTLSYMIGVLCMFAFNILSLVDDAIGEIKKEENN